MDNTEPIVAEKVDLRDVIKQKMKDEGRSLAWLVRSTGLSYNALRFCIVLKVVVLTQEKLDAINKALETTYTLPAE